MTSLVDNLKISVDEDSLHNDYTEFKSAWQTLFESPESPDKKWANFFQKNSNSEALLKVISTIFSIPPSNAE